MTETATLLRAVAQGDRDAFNALYRAERRPMLALSTGLLAGDSAAAEDVVSAAFVAIWQGAARWEGTSCAEARGWMRRIARNKAVDWLRANGRYDAGYEGDTGSVDPDDNPLAAALRRDAGGRLAHAMERLSTDQREAVMLCYFEEMSVTEIADIAGCPEGTVKTRLFHARKALRRELADMVLQ